MVGSSWRQLGFLFCVVAAVDVVVLFESGAYLRSFRKM